MEVRHILEENFKKFQKISNMLLEFFFNEKISIYCFGLLVLIFGIAFYRFNLHSTLIVDDYDYHYIFTTDKQVNNIYDIIISQYKHYFVWGGRSVVHFLAQFFLMLDKSVFNIINSFAYILLLIVIYFHAVGKIRFFPVLIIIINWLFFTCMPAFGQVFLWVTGASNYLWGPLIVLIYLLPYRVQFLKDSNIMDNKLVSVVFGACGIIAGWTNENMGITLVAMIGVAILWNKYQYNKIYFWNVCGLIGTIVGVAIMVLAPGNFERLAVIASNNDGNAVNVMKNFFMITAFFIKPKFLLFPIGISLIAVLLSKKIEDIKIIGWYILGMLVSMYSMVVSPGFPDRAKSGTLFLMTIIVCALYKNIDFENLKIRKMIAITIVMMFASVADNYSNGYKDIKRYEQRNKNKIEYVLSEKAKGNINDIIIQENYPSTQYCAAWGLSDIKNDPNEWPNTSFAKYFGVKSVRTGEK